MINQSKKDDPRYWAKWKASGAIGTINGRYTEGKAYSVIGVGASKEQIEAELPIAREAASTPSKLEISVRAVKDVMADKTTDPKLVKYLGQNVVFPITPKKYLGPVQFKSQPLEMSRLNYILEARLPDTGNEKAAAEITDITNYLYYSFGENKPFYADIIAKAPDGQYDHWEND